MTAGISEEACALRLLMKHSRRDAIRRFTTMRGLHTWPDASVLMAMQVLLQHGAHLVEDPADPDNSLVFAEKRLAAASSNQQDTSACQRLLELIQEHLSDEQAAALPWQSAAAQTRCWGEAPAADVRAVMRHVLRYARDPQRRALSHHPHCATAALAAAAGMGPQMRDVVHWMLAIAANVNGVDLRQLRSKPKRRRPAASCAATTEAQEPAGVPAASSDSAQCTASPADTYEHPSPPTSHPTTSNHHHTPPSHIAVSADSQQHTASSVLDQGGPFAHSQWQATVAEHNDCHGCNGHEPAAAESTSCSSPEPDCGADVLLHKASPDSLGDGPVKGTVSAVADIGTNGKSIHVLKHVSANGGTYGLANGVHSSLCSASHSAVCAERDSPQGDQQHHSQTPHSAAAVAAEQAPPHSNGLANGHSTHIQSQSSPEPHHHTSQPSTPDSQADADFFANPFVAMQKQHYAQHQQHSSPPSEPHHPSHHHHHSNRHHHHEALLDGSTEIDLQLPAAGEAESDPTDGPEGSGDSWLDFLDPELPSRGSSGLLVRDDDLLGDEGDGCEVEEQGYGDGDSGEVDRWVLCPLAEAAAAGDRYLVELLLEVHGADPNAYGGLPERMARANGQNMIAKIIYEKALAQAAARGQHVLSPQRAGAAAGATPAAGSGEPSFQYVTIGDYIRSQLPSWPASLSRWWGGKGAETAQHVQSAVVYRSCDHERSRRSRALRVAQAGLALVTAATAGYFIYTCVAGGTRTSSDSAGQGGGDSAVSTSASPHATQPMPRANTAVAAR